MPEGGTPLILTAVLFMTKHPAPLLFKGVMVSSTSDLAAHRRALARAIDAEDLHPLMMESDSARPVINVLESSLQMVEQAAAYVLVISFKYGQIPETAEHNPDGLSLTELEFNKALELGLPILLFLMGPNHPVIPADFELDAEKRKKLDAFRERAKLFDGKRGLHRVYKVFNDQQEFTSAAAPSIAELRRHLDETEPDAEPRLAASDQETAHPIPKPPELHAEPPYMGSHDFVGREDELNKLSEWAAASDPHPVLLFEAIGGSGKSMLTWQWTKRHAAIVRNDWAGRFWYSFYEKGAYMEDFCRHALAYMTARPVSDFKKKKLPELKETLLHQLRAAPWLLVLDGLERVLVAYHRIDAAQVLMKTREKPTRSRGAIPLRRSVRMTTTSFAN